MKIDIKKWEWITLAVLFILGFIIGRMTIQEPETKQPEIKETVRYFPAPYEIRDTIREPQPYSVYHTKIDTLYLPSVSNPSVIDTLKVIEDYFLTRNYRLDFSSDTTGVFIVDARIHQNRLIGATSEIKPIVRTIEREKTVYETRTVAFYGMLGTSVNLDAQKISAGVDLKQRYLIGVSGMRLRDNYNYTIDFGIKF